MIRAVPDQSDAANTSARDDDGRVALDQGRCRRTRPLCPYPQVATYTGTGSIDAAASFVCT
jgi:feruloyl esterase